MSRLSPETRQDAALSHALAPHSVGDVSIVASPHDSLTPEQALNHAVEHYQAWAANRPGGRL
jgi:hypothetical protein